MRILWWRKKEEKRTVIPTTIISCGTRLILPLGLAQMMVAASRALQRDEMGGDESMFLLKIGRDGKNFKVKEVQIPHQKVSQVNCMLDPNLSLDLLKDWEGHWAHSHAEMDVFFSSIDDSTIENILKWLKLYQKSPFIISIVFNNKGEFLAKISALLNNNQILEIFTDVIIEINLFERDHKIEEEITEKVKRISLFHPSFQKEVRKNAGEENHTAPPTPSTHPYRHCGGPGDSPPCHSG